MKIESGRVLDRLPAEERCRGAIFTSYSFDPAFFEENVLRAVLRLTSDPIEQAERYHNEARRALQETPVAVVVDAGERRAGRRLPYDLLEVSEVVFHPKSVLLLYRDFARLLIGSGNLTRPGFGENTELFVSTDLIYASNADMSLLDGFDQHLGRIEALVRRTGTQLQQIRDEIQRKSRSASPSPSAGLAFLDSTTGPIMDQFAALIPADALVTSVGMLAPFYETDDVEDAGVPDESSVFGAFAGRIAPESTLDVGLRWENPQIQPTAPADLNNGLNRIWAFKSSESDNVLAFRIPTELTRNTMFYLDGAGQRRRMPLEEAIASVENRTSWMQPDPLVFAPRQTIANAAKRFSKVLYWLHPASRIADGRVAHRPLHAKMLAVAYRAGTDEATLILMGSPNMSRRALLLQSGKGLGNVEIGLAFSIEGRFELRDFVPDLVHVPPSACTPAEREFPAKDRNFALAIDEASHDPGAKTLRVSWASSATGLPPWRLSYDGRDIASSVEPPSATVHVGDFTLKPSTAEVVLHVNGKEYPAPILVTDLVGLPVTTSGTRVGLDELLMLLSRRVGTERALLIAERRNSKSEDGLTALFGEGFSPTDVFKAWWCAAEDIADADLSVQGFRLRLEGALGIGAAWSCMLDAVQHSTMAREEAWLFGAELLRSLSEFNLPQSPELDAKMLIMTAFKARVRSDMEAFHLSAGTRSWKDLVLRFYGETTA
ncbi:hypothetical protein HAP47_0005195 [Bradyrhizobium sp. 41S5]|uniref:hypothetical protein n=1 Tax=Bradyrhizobium sp. 41S5 TaxID=1404443 RepID=UPI00156AC54A|nr:hypothetical protein [Bradyrhizobium sp. 41S5]UFX46113.1 hypothetical protein HAP47_0005195 [Bradyrhizobium sp. 41S5]